MKTGADAVSTIKEKLGRNRERDGGVWREFGRGG